jgi:hypothetical protein
MTKTTNNEMSSVYLFGNDGCGGNFASFDDQDVWLGQRPGHLMDGGLTSAELQATEWADAFAQMR